jgi:hypothetical protein
MQSHKALQFAVQNLELYLLQTLLANPKNANQNCSTAPKDGTA